MFDLREFDTYREDNRREIKKAKGGLPASIWETYSAFANTEGGVMILGVKENEDGSWVTTGLDNESKLKKEFWDTINNSNKVSENLLTENNVRTYEKNGDIIMVITVPKASRESRPVYINGKMFGGTYRRNWEGDYKVSRAGIKAMLRDQPEGTSDMKVLDDFSVSVLNYETIQGYRNRHRSFNPGHPFLKLDDENYLQRIGAAAVSKMDGKLHPTGAGLLMFGNEYDIIREYPEYFLDYRRMTNTLTQWSDRIYSSSGEWSGNICDFYFRVYNKIAQELKVPFKMVGGDRIDDTDIHKAIREVLANCLINTDYFVSQSIVVKLDDEKLILENPGYIRTGKEQMIKGGKSDPRNKMLMKMFNLIDIGEHAGSGIPRVFDAWKSIGWKEPIIEEQYEPDRTILILPFEYIKNKAVNKKTDKKAEKKAEKKADKKAEKKADIDAKREKKILNYIKAYGSINNTEARELLNLADSTTKRFLKSLVDTGKLIAEGERKSRKYVLPIK